MKPFEQVRMKKSDEGVEAVDDRLLARTRSVVGDLDVFWRRGVYTSHRDFGLVLKDFEESRGFFTLIGSTPSGRLHMGQLLRFLSASSIQKSFHTDLYIQIYDDAFLPENRRLSGEYIQRAVREDVLDIIAVEFDEDRTFIFQDSEYIGRMYRAVLEAAKRLEAGRMKTTFGFRDRSNVGALFSPALKIAPTFFDHKRCLIPTAVGEDPHWLTQRGIAEELGYFKAAQLHLRSLPTLSGEGEVMSPLDPRNIVFLDEGEAGVREKIYRYAYSGGRETVALHRRYGGDPDVDTAFQWLKLIFEPDDSKLRQIEEDYRSGRLLSGELKNILIEKVNTFLERHREARLRAKDLVETFKSEGKLAKKAWGR